MHMFPSKIINPVLIAIPHKNILSRVAAMLIPIEKTIPLRPVAIAVRSAHIFDRVTL